ncbi:hypothetical protein Hanom_Chr02g00154761 [Helianthus anomalus]
MMEDKFGRKDSDSSESDSDGDDGDGGNAGAGGVSGASASTAGTAGTSSAGDGEEDTESDGNVPEPGYEFYLDERGVRQVRKIRREDDDDDEYVPSDTEAEHLKRKQTAARQKKKTKKNIGSSSVQQSVPQHEPTQETEMNPNLGFPADEVADMVSSPPRSSKQNHVVTLGPQNSFSDASRTSSLNSIDHSCNDFSADLRAKAK